ncbi:hypothetical protein KSS87_007249, partial [Heliosperma pusillum]
FPSFILFHSLISFISPVPLTLFHLFHFSCPSHTLSVNLFHFIHLFLHLLGFKLFLHVLINQRYCQAFIFKSFLRLFDNRFDLTLMNLHFFLIFRLVCMFFPD